MNEFETSLLNPELLNQFDGFVCTDNRGLCIEARGIMQTKTSGYSKGIMQCAQQLTNTENPTIILETDNGVVIIKQHQNITLAATKVNK